MSNELLWIVFLLLDLGCTILIFKYFRKEGLFAVIVANIILCNIQVPKIVELFGFTVTLGNILYGSIFLATDLLSEFYGKKEARRGVVLGFVFLVFMTVVMQIALMFQPAADGIEVHNALVSIFSLLPKIALGSLCAYILSQMHDVWLYHLLKERTSGRYLWIRNNVSTALSQLIDSVVFCTIAFWGLDRSLLVEIIFTTYVMKFIVSVVDTPFIYLARRIEKGITAGNETV
ncbi:MAG: queuosine precursor transporter [Spirochaetota bacterium]